MSNIEIIYKNRVTLVYYAFLNPTKDWWGIISAQLSLIKRVGLLNIAKLYVHFTGSNNLLNIAKSKLNKLNSNCTLSTSTTNQYEYPGLCLLWELCQKEPENIYFYFHSKGMVNSQENGQSQHNIRLCNITIVPWKKILNIFHLDQTVDTVMVGFGPNNDTWFNFWWVKGSYLQKCTKPILNSDRFYYEKYLRLSHPEPHSENIYSLIGQKKGFLTNCDIIMKITLYLIDKSTEFYVEDEYTYEDDGNIIQAFYGSEFYYLNVTDRLVHNFKKENKIIIPNTASLNYYFGDPHVNTIKTLTLYINQVKHIILENFKETQTFEIK